MEPGEVGSRLEERVARDDERAGHLDDEVGGLSQLARISSIWAIGPGEERRRAPVNTHRPPPTDPSAAVNGTRSGNEVAAAMSPKAATRKQAPDKA